MGLRQAYSESAIANSPTSWQVQFERTITSSRPSPRPSTCAF
jgi:hypothetical protein